MTYNIYDENDNIKVLIRNAVKCLVCGVTLESKYRHNFNFLLLQDGGDYYGQW